MQGTPFDEKAILDGLGALLGGRPPRIRRLLACGSGASGSGPPDVCPGGRPPVPPAPVQRSAERTAAPPARTRRVAADSGPPGFQHIPLAGGASNRSYHRILADGGRRFVVMVLAPEPIRSEEATAGPAPAELPFYEMQRFLEGRGVPVPALFRFDRERGHIWLEDLGDDLLLHRLEEHPAPDWLEAYGPAMALLRRFQDATRDPPDPAPICYRRRFEPALLRWELLHYVEWRVEVQLGRTVSPAARAALGSAFDGLVAELCAMPEIVCHRDFQSTNLLWRPGGGLAVIDFQDALLGPWTYDLVALLRDSYVPLPDAGLDRCIDHWLALCPDIDGGRFRRDFDLQTVQRKLKDAGRFVYIDRVKKNPWFLQHVDRTLGFVRSALRRLRAQHERLSDLLVKLDPEGLA